MNTYHYTYQIGKGSAKTETIEASTPEEAQLKSYELVKSKSKKHRQAIKKFYCSVEAPTYADEDEIEYRCQGVFDETAKAVHKLMDEPAPYSSNLNQQTPFLYFLSYAREEPEETGRVVAAIPFKLTSQLKIDLCERILADILECDVNNVILTDFILLNEWKET